MLPPARIRARRSSSTVVLSMPASVRYFTIETVVTGNDARQLVTVSVSLHCWSARKGIGSSGSNSGSSAANGRSAVHAVRLSPVMRGRPSVRTAATLLPRTKASGARRTMPLDVTCSESMASVATESDVLVMVISSSAAVVRVSTSGMSPPTRSSESTAVEATRYRALCCACDVVHDAELTSAISSADRMVRRIVSDEYMGRGHETGTTRTRKTAQKQLTCSATDWRIVGTAGETRRPVSRVLSSRERDG